MSLSAFLRALVTVFPAELPDKTMVATIVLVARYRRPVLVWLGAAGAFAVHVVVAVLAGGALSLLPDTVVKLVVATLFSVGAIVLFRAGRTSEARVETGEPEVAATAAATLTGSFGLIVVAEWGDLTQLATASLAAESGKPLSTGLGALVALVAVAGIAATFGRQLITRVPIHRVNYVGSAVFAALAVWTVIELLT